MEAAIVPEMTDEQFAYWLAGFADGEAHFNFTTKTTPSTGRRSASPRFALGLREDDEPVLRLMQERAGVGKIRRLSNESQRLAGKNARPSCVWEVTGPSCVVIADLLDGKMRSKKAREVALWAKAVRESASMPRYDDRRAPLLLRCREELMELRASKAPA